MNVTTLQQLRSACALAAMALFAVSGLPGCLATAVGEEEAEEPWEGETESDEDRGAQAEIGAAPKFQLPFPCKQAWTGQTRTNHSPQLALDFNRPGDEGDTVVAAASGRVTRVENLGNKSYGRWIEIDHGNGYTTRYAHLSTQVVKVGQKVVRGQKIGTVGNTGGSYGAHLHYEQRRYGYVQRASFDGKPALYFGTKTYVSNNCSTGGSSGGTGGATGRIDTPSGVPLTIRSGPGTNYPAIGSLADGTKVTIRCQKVGQKVTGTFGTSSLWDKVGNGYVADAYVYTGSDGRVAPNCP